MEIKKQVQIFSAISYLGKVSELFAKTFGFRQWVVHKEEEVDIHALLDEMKQTDQEIAAAQEELGGLLKELTSEDQDALQPVEYSEFNGRYNKRDADARKKMRDFVDSDANKVTNVFSTLFGR